jgi:hypothetical protein
MNTSHYVDIALIKNKKVEFEMELSKLKVGQLVEHDNGFIGEVKEITGSKGFTEVILEVVDSGTSCMEVGDTWRAMPSLILRVVKDVQAFKVEAELEFTGLEKLEELIGQAEEALTIINDAKPFKVTIDGIVFEGTTAQFDAFMTTMNKYKLD